MCNFSYTTVGRFICFTVLCNFLNSGLTVYALIGLYANFISPKVGQFLPWIPQSKLLQEIKTCTDTQPPWDCIDWRWHRFLVKDETKWGEYAEGSWSATFWNGVAVLFSTCSIKECRVCTISRWQWRQHALLIALSKNAWTYSFRASRRRSYIALTSLSTSNHTDWRRTGYLISFVFQNILIFYNG